MSAARSPGTDGEQLEPGKTYRVLSIKEAWAWAIVHAGKNVENRSWATPYRGRILIHASVSPMTRAALAEARRLIRSLAPKGARLPEEFPRGRILGSVELVDCADRSSSFWAERGACCWVLRDPRPIAADFTVNGKLGLWRWTAGAEHVLAARPR